jgi:hypothetical protein
MTGAGTPAAGWPSRLAAGLLHEESTGMSTFAVPVSIYGKVDQE